MENKQYQDFQGILVKKYKNIMSQYVLVLEENGIKKKVYVGKEIYNDAEIGSKWTVGIIGRKLINIRQGYANQIKLIDWKDSDANALFEMCLDNTLRKNGISYYDSIEDAKNVIKHWKNMKGCKVIIEKETNSFVGFIILSDMNRYDGYMELEYAIAEKYRNKGYATQAIKKMIDYGFREMNLCVIAAWVRSHNEPSVRCLEKNHFVFEGKLRKHARDKSDTLCYSLLREDWEKGNEDDSCEIKDN